MTHVQSTAVNYVKSSSVTHTSVRYAKSYTVRWQKTNDIVKTATKLLVQEDLISESESQVPLARSASSTPTADGKTINSKNAGSKYKDEDYIRVSDVLKMFPKGERFVHWYYKFKNYAAMREGLRQASERGSIVDDLTKKILNNEPHEVPPEYDQYILAFDKFRKDWDFEVLLSDQEVSDPELKYVGTLDLYGILKNKLTGKEEYVVIDIKTGVPTRDKFGNKAYETFRTMHCQTAAYARAISKTNRVTRTYILRLFSDGNYLLEPDKDAKLSFQQFKAALDFRRLIGTIE